MYLNNFISYRNYLNSSNFYKDMKILLTGKPDNKTRAIFTIMNTLALSAVVIVRAGVEWMRGGDLYGRPGGLRSSWGGPKKGRGDLYGFHR